MQVCTSLQTDNHASTPPFCFLQAGCPSCRPANRVKALKAIRLTCIKTTKRLCRQTYFTKCHKHQKYKTVSHVLTRSVRLSFCAVATTLLGSRRTVNWTLSSFLRGLPTAQSTVLLPDKLHEYLLPYTSTTQQDDNNSNKNVKVFPKPRGLPKGHSWSLFSRPNWNVNGQRRWVCFWTDVHWASGYPASM